LHSESTRIADTVQGSNRELGIGSVAIQQDIPYEQWKDGFRKTGEIVFKVKDTMIVQGNAHADIMQ